MTSRKIRKSVGIVVPEKFIDGKEMAEWIISTIDGIKTGVYAQNVKNRDIIASRAVLFLNEYHNLITIFLNYDFNSIQGDMLKPTDENIVAIRVWYGTRDLKIFYSPRTLTKIVRCFSWLIGAVCFRFGREDFCRFFQQHMRVNEEVSIAYIAPKMLRKQKSPMAISINMTDHYGRYNYAIHEKWDIEIIRLSYIRKFVGKDPEIIRDIVERFGEIDKIYYYIRPSDGNEIPFKMDKTDVWPDESNLNGGTANITIHCPRPLYQLYAAEIKAAVIKEIRQFINIAENASISLILTQFDGMMRLQETTAFFTYSVMAEDGSRSHEISVPIEKSEKNLSIFL